jgi:hypothetical protein
MAIFTFPMSKMVKRIRNISFYALLMSVYTVFFSVQLFFNFDCPGSGNVSNFLRYFCSGNHPEKTASIARKAPSQSSSRSIRLNKRFHQEDICPCDVLCVDSPRSNFITRTLGLHRDGFLPPVNQDHTLLRGPPSQS